MYKLMNWNTIEYFEEKEDCLEACLTATLDLYKQNFVALANAIYTKSYFVACEGGYVDKEENDGDVYTKEEMLEFLWDFASCMQDWNKFAKEKICPIQEKLTRQKKILVGLTILTTKFQN